MSTNKHLEADDETHEIVRVKAFELKISMKKYTKLCILGCKSDVGLIPLSTEEKHKNIMTLLGLSEDSIRDDIIGTNLVNIYDHIMDLKVML